MIRLYIKKHLHECIVGVFILVYISYFTTITFLRHDNFYSGRYDLGNMDQVVWNTSQGRIFETSTDDFDGVDRISRLMSHADFILIFIVPLYYMWSDPKVLLLLQSVILGVGAWFVYRIAHLVLQNKKIALVLAFLFLINPGVNHSNLYDFHAVTLATTFLLASFYFLLQKKTLYFLLFALLAALTKEQVWITVGLFGLYMSIFQKKMDGLLVFLFSISVFVFLIWYAIPNARLNTDHFALSYYSEFGSSPTEIITSAIFSPTKTIGIFLNPQRIEFIKQLFIPLGFLSLLAPFYVLFALTDLLISLLSNNRNLYQIYYHYTSSITSFVFISAIFGIKTLSARFSSIKTTHLVCYLLTIGFLSAYWYGPLPFAKSPNFDMVKKPSNEKEVINRIITQIPSNKSVSATNNLGAHLSHRQKIFTVPVYMEKADIVVFLLNDQAALPSPQAQIEMVGTMKQNKNYSLSFEEGDFFLFERATPSGRFIGK